MTQIVDAAGNAAQISYDTNFRVVAVTDAIGQVTPFTYGQTNDIYKITKVTDPFGRFASFSYDFSSRLAQITDVIGLTSQFPYDSGAFIQAMTTPYCTTSFQKGGTDPNRWLVTTYPDGEQERVEFIQSSTISIPDSGPLATVPAGLGRLFTNLGYPETLFLGRQAYTDT